VLTGAIVTLCGVALAWPVANYLLGQAELTPYLQLGFLTLFALSISSYPGTILAGLQEFGKNAVASLANAAITVAGILLLLFSGTLTLWTLVGWNVVLPVVSTVPAWWLLRAEWQPWHRLSGGFLHGGIARELFSFGRWAATSSMGAIIAAQADLIILGRLLEPAAVGIYSVAVTLAMRLDTLNQSIFTVLMPRASRLQSSQEVRSYMRRTFAVTSLLAGGVALVALVVQPFIVLLYGPAYAESAGLFLVLSVVVVLDLVVTPLLLAAFPLNKPRILAAVEWIRVGVIVGTGWALVGALGTLGAALARILSRIVSAVYIAFAFRRALASHDGSAAAGVVPAGESGQLWHNKDQ
jgi:O-antigen/teichoic acid export membrane protein